MTEIEKLYEITGVEKSKCWDDCYTCTRTSCAKNISYVEAKYPPFTEEKQLELFLFVTSLGVCEVEDWKERGFHLAIKRKIYPTTFLSLSNINFKETLADIVINLWQDLTEEERDKIYGILRTI